MLATSKATSPIGVFERDHIAAGDGHPLGGHRWSAAGHVPGRIGFAERAFGTHAIHRIDDEVAALRGARAGPKTDALGRGAAENDGLDAAGLELLIEIVADELVRSARFLLEQLALARRDGLVDDLAAAGQRIRDEHAGRAGL